MKFKASIEQAGPSSFDQLVSVLLHSVSQTHLMHWKTDSFSQHMALGEFYDEMSDAVDSLVEEYQGKFSKKIGTLSVEFLPADNPLYYLSDLADEIKKFRSAADFPKDSEIQNEVDNIANLVNTTLYKLRFLK